MFKLTNIYALTNHRRSPWWWWWWWWWCLGRKIIQVAELELA